MVREHIRDGDTTLREAELIAAFAFGLLDDLHTHAARNRYD